MQTYPNTDLAIDLWQAEKQVGKKCESNTNHLSAVPELNVFITCIAFSHIDSGSELRKGNDRILVMFASVVKPTDTNFAVRLFCIKNK